MKYCNDVVGTADTTVSAMSPPPVRINTFVQPTTIPFIDSITKIFIICEFLLGYNRLPLVTEKWAYIIPSAIYNGVVLCAMLYGTIEYRNINFNYFPITINTALYIASMLFTVIFCKRIRRYYCELNKFDIEVGCRPTFTKDSIKNLIQTCLIIMAIPIIFCIPYRVPTLAKLVVNMAPLHTVMTLEVHYYGHLLNLLTPRLRLINYYMHTSLACNEDTKENILKQLIFFKNYDKSKNCQMKKITDLYYVIVKAHNYLMEAIKWQLLLILISSFISTLAYCYHFSQKIMHSEYVIDDLISDWGLMFIVMIPLFAPCIFADQVHSEVRQLKELVASRLYENKLDKSSRSIARTLLVYTETRNLSFTLLRVLNIDMSLPFKFIGLLITYLIILLQFQKVINPGI